MIRFSLLLVAILSIISLVKTDSGIKTLKNFKVIHIFIHIPISGQACFTVSQVTHKAEIFDLSRFIYLYFVKKFIILPAFRKNLSHFECDPPSTKL